MRSVRDSARCAWRNRRRSLQRPQSAMSSRQASEVSRFSSSGLLKNPSSSSTEGMSGDFSTRNPADLQRLSRCSGFRRHLADHGSREDHRAVLRLALGKIDENIREHLVGSLGSSTPAIASEKFSLAASSFASSSEASLRQRIDGSAGRLVGLLGKLIGVDREEQVPRLSSARTRRARAAAGRYRRHGSDKPRSALRPRASP